VFRVKITIKIVPYIYIINRIVIASSQLSINLSRYDILFKPLCHVSSEGSHEVAGSPYLA
jgi:hypothetical protein